MSRRPNINIGAIGHVRKPPKKYLIEVIEMYNETNIRTEEDTHMLKAYSIFIQDPNWDNFGELVFAEDLDQAKHLALKYNGHLRESVDEGAKLFTIHHENVDHIARQHGTPECIYSIDIQRQCGWLIKGDSQCDTCELYSMDGEYPVCDECHNCIECKCDSHCPLNEGDISPN